MDRRQFLGSVAGLAGAVAVGSVPAAGRPEREEPTSESESLYDWRSFEHDELGTLEVKVIDGHHDAGVFGIRTAVWAQRLVQEYRSHDYDGTARFWLYPDQVTFERDTGSPYTRAIGSGEEMNIYTTHPSTRGPAGDELGTLPDPRVSTFFRSMMHEYVHAEDQNLASRKDGYRIPPGWFTHGFTEFTTKNHLVNYYRTVKRAVEDDALLALDEIGHSEEYAYGLFIATHLIDRHGMGAMADVYKSSESTFEAALESVLGKSVAEFETAVHDRLRSWFEGWTIPEPGRGRTLAPEDRIRPDPMPDVSVGSPPDLGYCRGGDSGFLDRITDGSGAIDTEGLQLVIRKWATGESITGDCGG